MDESFYIEYRREGSWLESIWECLAKFVVRTGRRPAVVVAHATESETIARIMDGQDVVSAVATLPVGGPHQGEIWVQ